MKEILTNEGFEKIGGCRCNGGADFYQNKSYPAYRIDWYYRRGYLVLKKHNRQVNKGIEAEVNQLIQQVKNPIN